jgi:hypothetical protein
LDEAFKIRDKFFPDCKIEYLFEDGLKVSWKGKE